MGLIRNILKISEGQTSNSLGENIPPTVPSGTETLVNRDEFLSIILERTIIGTVLLNLLVACGNTNPESNSIVVPASNPIVGANGQIVRYNSDNNLTPPPNDPPPPNPPNLKELQVAAFEANLKRKGVELNSQNVHEFAKQILSDPDAPDGILERLAKGITYINKKQFSDALDRMAEDLKKLKRDEYILDPFDEKPSSSNHYIVDQLKERKVELPADIIPSAAFKETKATLFLDDASYSALQAEDIIEEISKTRNPKADNQFYFVCISSFARESLTRLAKQMGVRLSIHTYFEDFPLASQVLLEKDLEYFYTHMPEYEGWVKDVQNMTHIGNNGNKVSLTDNEKKQEINKLLKDWKFLHPYSFLWFYFGQVSDNFFTPITEAFLNRPPLVIESEYHR